MAQRLGRWRCWSWVQMSLNLLRFISKHHWFANNLQIFWGFISRSPEISWNLLGSSEHLRRHLPHEWWLGATVLSQGGGRCVFSAPTFVVHHRFYDLIDLMAQSVDIPNFSNFLLLHHLFPGQKLPKIAGTPKCPKECNFVPGRTWLRMRSAWMRGRRPPWWRGICAWRSPAMCRHVQQ